MTLTSPPLEEKMKILFITPGTYPVPAVKGGAVENLIEMLISSKEVTREK